MDSTGNKLPKIARVAAVLTLILAALAAFSAITTGQFLNLIPIPIFLVAAAGMLRGRAWSAYGVCLLETAGLAVLLIIRLRDGLHGFSADAAAGLMLAVFYFFVGRRLAASGAPAGNAVPWIALACAISVPFLFVQAYTIPTGTMENTLLIGDFVLVERWPSVVPKRGNMMVYRYQAKPPEAFIKRVIGVPGDRIRIANKQVFLNGQPLQESYAIHKTDYIDPYRDNFPGRPTVPLEPEALDMLDHHVINGEVVVPKMSYFVLGDNRDNSFDSRFTGFVKGADLMGKPLMIYWSRETSPDGKAPRGPIRWNRVFKLL